MERLVPEGYKVLGAHSVSSLNLSVIDHLVNSVPGILVRDDRWRRWGFASWETECIVRVIRFQLSYVEHGVDPHVVGELQPVRNIRNNLLHSEETRVPWCKLAYLSATGECKVGCREVHVIPRLEYKGAAACICVLFLSVLCNSEESLGMVDGGGDILQKIASGRGHREGRF
jgi:hypothetical protein